MLGFNLDKHLENKAKEKGEIPDQPMGSEEWGRAGRQIPDSIMRTEEESAKYNYDVDDYKVENKDEFKDVEDVPAEEDLGSYIGSEQNVQEAEDAADDELTKSIYAGWQGVVNNAARNENEKNKDLENKMKWLEKRTADRSYEFTKDEINFNRLCYRFSKGRQGYDRPHFNAPEGQTGKELTDAQVKEAAQEYIGFKTLGKEYYFGNVPNANPKTKVDMIQKYEDSQFDDGVWQKPMRFFIKKENNRDELVRVINVNENGKLKEQIKYIINHNNLYDQPKNGEHYVVVIDRTLKKYLDNQGVLHKIILVDAVPRPKEAIRDWEKQLEKNKKGNKKETGGSHSAEEAKL